jgi:hypothetical protein
MKVFIALTLLLLIALGTQHLFRSYDLKITDYFAILMRRDSGGYTLFRKCTPMSEELIPPNNWLQNYMEVLHKIRTAGYSSLPEDDGSPIMQKLSDSTELKDGRVLHKVRILSDSRLAFDYWMSWPTPEFKPMTRTFFVRTSYECEERVAIVMAGELEKP